MFSKNNEMVDLLKQINHKLAVILSIEKSNRIKKVGGKNVK